MVTRDDVYQLKVRKILGDNFYIRDNAQHVSGWTVEEDGRVTVYGDLNLVTHHSRLPLRFHKVFGSFECFDKGLRTLEGAPDEVYGDFGAEQCQLTTLQGAPKNIGGYFNVSGNHISDLTHFPESIGGSIFLANNNLKSLRGLPETVSDDLEIHNNDLTTLEGLSRKIAGWVTLDYTPKMPLLRTLGALHVNLVVSSEDGGSALKTKIQTILNDTRWIGQGRAGAIDCKRALVEAGFEGNARW